MLPSERAIGGTGGPPCKSIVKWEKMGLSLQVFSILLVGRKPAVQIHHFTTLVATYHHDCRWTAHQLPSAPEGGEPFLENHFSS